MLYIYICLLIIDLITAPATPLATQMVRQLCKEYSFKASIIKLIGL
jgi:hypothetical protein